MTHEDLVSFGYKPTLIKIGTAYFKSNFYGFLKNGVFDFRYADNDMQKIADVKTLDELKEQEIQYYLKQIHYYESLIDMNKIYLETVYNYNTDSNNDDHNINFDSNNDTHVNIPDNMFSMINIDAIKTDKLVESSNIESVEKFKYGDAVCFKCNPKVKIGTVSEDFGDSLHVFTSDEYFKEYAQHGGPNTLTVQKSAIQLYKN